MTREEAKALLPIIQAYTEGKTIQTKIKTDSQGLAEEWIDVINPDLDGNPWLLPHQARTHLSPLQRCGGVLAGDAEAPAIRVGERQKYWDL